MKNLKTKLVDFIHTINPAVLTSCSIIAATVIIIAAIAVIKNSRTDYVESGVTKDLAAIYENTSSSDEYSSDITESTTNISTTMQEATAETTVAVQPTTSKTDTATIPFKDLEIKESVEDGDVAMGEENKGFDDDYSYLNPPDTTTIKPTTTPTPTTTITPTTQDTIQSTTQVTIDSSGDTTNDSDEVGTYILTSGIQSLPAAIKGSAGENFELGIDVSYYQGTIDWAKVKASGVEFAIIKVGGRGYGSGSLYYDAQYKNNIEGALKNNIKVGLYVFSQAINVQEAREEASFIIAVAKQYNITYPLVFDWETKSTVNSSGQYTWRTYAAQAAGTLTRSGLTTMASTFCDMVQAAGYKAMNYGSVGCAWNGSAKYTKWDPYTLANKYYTWVAGYYDPSVYPWPTKNMTSYPDFLRNKGCVVDYQFYQYTSSGSVNGIKGRVDLDIAYTPKLNVNQTNYLTMPNGNINLTGNASAVDAKGINYTSRIGLTITNSSGTSVSLADALKSADLYTLTYKLSDFALLPKTVTGTLRVRNAPSITLKKQHYVYSIGTSLANIQADMFKYIIVRDADNNSIGLTLNNLNEININTAGTYTIKMTAADRYNYATSTEVTVQIKN